MTAHDPLADSLPIGVNTFVWHSPLTQDRAATTLDTIAVWGYEGVELALEQVGDWDVDAISEQLERLRLRSVVGGVFGPGRELVAVDTETIERTQEYVRAAIAIAARQGSALVIGPLYTSVGRTWRLVPDERRHVLKDLREALAPLVDAAATAGVPLALEPLNRYETSLFNTTEQLLELIDPFPAEGVGLNLDTYHMNIEEKSLDAAFRSAGDRLLHLQVCGNDRGAPGEDHLDWAAIRDSLVAIDYRGMLGFESFTSDNETIATAASIWRPFARTQDELAQRALSQLRSWRSGWPRA
ncbi:sugar phosphate isomerase/epimerase family protein [uncultured Amnibacterium sp.]|uniref:sugar phosphate isomerase/epimerase family protein n=1 Tax=uncultured Amnibacterium sp. TaxID=1631851 RepID=UPI0035C9A72A